VCVLVLLTVALLLDAAWFEPSSLLVASYQIRTSPRLKGLRIAVISDLHAGAPFIDIQKVDRIVDMTNATRPDVVLLAGDYVVTGMLGSRHIAIEEIAKHLRGLRSRLGVYAVIGNHDRWENAQHISDALLGVGISVLENRSINTGGVTIVGIGDSVTHASNVSLAMAGVSKDAICLTHSPDIFLQLPPTCGLTIAGHTHGGQVKLPLVGRPAVSVLGSRYGQRYAIGVVREGPKTLFINSGIGTSLLPIRFGVPPEISLLELN
jgi:predicted MPP superfamily phosphohydrolase